MQEQWKLWVTWVGNRCHVLLIVQTWPPLISTCLSLKEFQYETKFSSNDKMKSTMNKWLRIQSKDFLADRFQKVVFWLEKCVLNNGNYIEKLSKKNFSAWNVHHYITKCLLSIEWSFYIYICVCVSMCVCVYIYIYIYVPGSTEKLIGWPRYSLI